MVGVEHTLKQNNASIWTTTNDYTLVNLGLEALGKTAWLL
jgi:hypothetical protein